VVVTILVLGPIVWAGHELGHVLAWRALGVRATGVAVSLRHAPRGLGIRYAADRRTLTRRQQFLGAAWGPALSLLLAVVLWRQAPLIAAGSLELAAVNLVPFRGSDGRTMLRVLRP
jgi:hypothetical protein